MELKQIPTDKILANFTQPRVKFEKEGIKELAESILSNGLINPITVRTWKDKFMIVAGERRWRSHKLAKLKTVQAIVKEYRNDVDWQIESLVENLMREDLTSIEREKYIHAIWETGKFKNHRELAKKIGFKDKSSVAQLIRAKEDRETLGIRLPTISTLTLKKTEGMEDKDRKRLLQKVEKGELIQERIKEMAPIISKAPEEVKEALLSDEISVEQAKSLTKIESPKAREQALKQVKQHRHIADIIPRLKEKANPELTDALKKRMNSIHKIIFLNLHDGRVGLIKANKNLNKVNIMLSQLMQYSFEDGLPEKTMRTTIQQMIKIFDEINKFNIQSEKFEELKETFVERIEDRIK